MKYIIKESSTQPNGWVLADTENMIVIRFEDGKFNETQNVSILEDSWLSELQIQEKADRAAEVMRQMGDWAARHHGSKLFSQPHGFEYSEDNKHLYLYRRKYPRLRIEIDEQKVQGDDLKKALKAMASFLMKNKIYTNDSGGENSTQD